MLSPSGRFFLEPSKRQNLVLRPNVVRARHRHRVGVCGLWTVERGGHVTQKRPRIGKGEGERSPHHDLLAFFSTLPPPKLGRKSQVLVLQIRHHGQRRRYQMQKCKKLDVFWRFCSGWVLRMGRKKKFRAMHYTFCSRQSEGGPGIFVHFPDAMSRSRYFFLPALQDSFAKCRY